MHTVLRGRAPLPLGDIRRRYTQRWIDFYASRRGKKPTDTLWRRFEPDLRVRFFGLCGYCEELCKGEVDHFRPKTAYPHLVYSWGNWIYSCHTCNNLKGEKWIAAGYVNPCATAPSQRPECFFRFDTKTGELVLKQKISNIKSERAVKTRDELKLNAYHHLKQRVLWLRVIAELLDSTKKTPAKRKALVTLFASRETRLSSLARAYLAEQGIVVPK